MIKVIVFWLGFLVLGWRVCIDELKLFVDELKLFFVFYGR